MASYRCGICHFKDTMLEGILEHFTKEHVKDTLKLCIKEADMSKYIYYGVCRKQFQGKKLYLIKT